MTQVLEPVQLGGGVRDASGSRADFSSFFHESWPDLISFCRTLTGSESLAEEISQEALTRVFVRYPLLTEPRPYLFRVAANLVNRTWRQAQRVEVRDPAAFPDGAVEAGTDDTIDAVRRLPARLRHVVILYYYADLPVEEVAGMLRRPVGTIKRRLHEARTQLAQLLNEDVS